MYYLGKRIKGTGLIKHIEITEEDFVNFKRLYDKFNDLEKILIIKNIAIKSNIDFKQFIANINYTMNHFKEIDFDLKLLHFHGVDLILKCILLNKTYFENSKKYIKEKSLCKYYKNKYKEVEKSFDYVFLRILRNYACHNSLPITNTTKCYNVLTQKYEDILFEINKQIFIDEIINNGREDDKNIYMLRNNLADNIIINDYIDEWVTKINIYYKVILKSFGESIRQELMDIKDKHREIIISTNAYPIKINQDSTYDICDINIDLYKEVILAIKDK